MRIVESTRDQSFCYENGSVAYSLSAGQRYVMYDIEARHLIDSGDVRDLGELDQHAPRGIDGTHTWLFFSGGLGDALVTLSCLNGIRKSGTVFDVVCKQQCADVFELFGSWIRTHRHPLPCDELDADSKYVSLESLGPEVQRGGRTNLQIFAEALGVPDPQEAVRLQWPTTVSSVTPQVAIALTNHAHVRAYPADLSLQVAKALIQRGVAVSLLGLGKEIMHPLADAPPMLNNLVDRLPSVRSLVEKIAQMHAVVTPDAFFMHLAGVLRIPTFGIFTSSEPDVAGGYPTVHPLLSRLDCSPCGAGLETCPLGHQACLAPWHDDLRPARIAERVWQMIQQTAGGSTNEACTVQYKDE